MGTSRFFAPGLWAKGFRVPPDRRDSNRQRKGIPAAPPACRLRPKGGGQRKRQALRRAPAGYQMIGVIAS